MIAVRAGKGSSHVSAVAADPDHGAWISPGKERIDGVKNIEVLKNLQIKNNTLRKDEENIQIEHNNLVLQKPTTIYTL